MTQSQPPMVPTPLSYGSLPAGPRGVPRRQMIVVYALAIVAGCIAGRAELLNVAAGSYLPRTKPLDTGKWRASIATNEQWWRRSYGPKDAAGEPVTRELTAAERGRMEADVAANRANNDLRDWIGTAGCVQYLLLPLLGLAILVSLSSRPTSWDLVLLALPAVVAVAAFASLWHRQYLTSLGW